MMVAFAVVHDVCVCWVDMVVVLAVVHDVCVCWLGVVVVFAVVHMMSVFVGLAWWLCLQ